MVPTAFVGTAGWQIGADTRAHFTASGSHLEQYASTFNAAEINSCFYRPHRRSTYERWAATVPKTFRFSAKLPKLITHELRFVGVKAALTQFISEVEGLGDRLGVLLVQLPPSFELEPRAARAFFRRLIDLPGSPRPPSPAPSVACCTPACTAHPACTPRRTPLSFCSTPPCSSSARPAAGCRPGASSTTPRTAWRRTTQWRCST